MDLSPEAKRAIDSYLLSRGLLVLAVIGIADIAGLVGLCYAVLATARTEANEVAQVIVRSDSGLDVARQQVLTNLMELKQKIGELDEKHRSNKSEADKLTALIDETKKNDQIEILQKVTALLDSPAGKDLLNSVSRIAASENKISAIENNLKRFDFRPSGAIALKDDLFINRIRTDSPNGMDVMFSDGSCIKLNRDSAGNSIQSFNTAKDPITTYIYKRTDR